MHCDPMVLEYKIIVMFPWYTLQHHLNISVAMITSLQIDLQKEGFSEKLILSIYIRYKSQRKVLF